MAFEVAPFPLPPSADAEMLKDFGRYVTSACKPIVITSPHTSSRLPSEVKGVHPGKLTPEQFQEIHDLLYKVCTFTSVTCFWRPHSLQPAWCSLVPKCRGDPRGAIRTHQGIHWRPTQPRVSPPYLLLPGLRPLLRIVRSRKQ